MRKSRLRDAHFEPVAGHLLPLHLQPVTEFLREVLLLYLLDVVIMRNIIILHELHPSPHILFKVHLLHKCRIAFWTLIVKRKTALHLITTPACLCHLFHIEVDMSEGGSVIGDSVLDVVGARDKPELAVRAEDDIQEVVREVLTNDLLCESGTYCGATQDC